MSRGLHQAVVSCRFKHVRFLLDFGIPLNTVDEHGRSPLVLTLDIQNEKKRYKMFKMLLLRGARYNVSDARTGMDLLSCICKRGYYILLQLLLEKTLGDLKLDHVDQLGWSALHYAARSGDTDMVRLLVNAMKKYDLPIDMRTRDGVTPYLLAKRLGFREIANLLEKYEPAKLTQNYMDNGVPSAGVNNRATSLPPYKGMRRPTIKNKVRLSADSFDVPNKNSDMDTLPKLSPVSRSLPNIRSQELEMCSTLGSTGSDKRVFPRKCFYRTEEPETSDVLLSKLLDVSSQELSFSFRRQAVRPRPPTRTPSRAANMPMVVGLMGMFQKDVFKKWRGQAKERRRKPSALPLIRDLPDH